MRAACGVTSRWRVDTERAGLGGRAVERDAGSLLGEGSRGARVEAGEALRSEQPLVGV